MGTLKDRATAVFAQAAERITEDCKVMHADHAAKGILKSGSTAKKAVRIFFNRSREGLSQVLGEIAQQIEHRGSAWKAAMAGVKEALDAHTSSASDLLAPSFKFAAPPGTAAGNAVEELIAKCAADLQSQLDDYQHDWTAPKPKPWIELHPVWYAIALLVLGSLIGALTTYLTGGAG